MIYGYIGGCKGKEGKDKFTAYQNAVNEMAVTMGCENNDVEAMKKVMVKRYLPRAAPSSPEVFEPFRLPPRRASDNGAVVKVQDRSKNDSWAKDKYSGKGFSVAPIETSHANNKQVGHDVSPDFGKFLRGIANDHLFHGGKGFHNDLGGKGFGNDLGGKGFGNAFVGNETDGDNESD